MFNREIFKNTILFLIVAELFSLTSYVYPALNTVAFFVVLGLVLVIAWLRFEWALYIVLAELFVGSFGRLFAWEFDGTLVSLRIGIFLIIMAVWLGKLISQGGLKSAVRPFKDFFSTKVGKWYGLLGIVLLWGVVWGLVRNDFANVFFDFNNWLYLLYILPFWQTFKMGSAKQENLRNVLSVLGAAVIVMSVKTLLLEWFFAHQIVGTLEILYKWVRDFGIGEITFYASNFYRVFIQGQVWLLLGFFIFFAQRLFNKDLIRRDKRLIDVILVLSSLSLIISFSRSLWLGWALGLGTLLVLLLFKFKWGVKRVFGLGIKILGVLILELIIIIALINIPPVRDAGDFSYLLSQRVTQIEAAGSSRINLLQPLGEEIIKHPLIGSGFGATVTYISADPRIVGSTAGGSGEYTTFAFEWAYLDILLKIGLVGLVIYLGLLWHLFRVNWRRLHDLDIKNLAHVFGFMSALVALILTNVTTPYLNHPLGIGFVILMTVFVGFSSSRNQLES